MANEDKAPPTLPASPPARPGRSFPLGARLGRGGVNFSLFSKHAIGVELLFFDAADDRRPSRSIILDPVTHRSGQYWHVFVPGIQAGQIYGYHVAGPDRPAAGLRFDADKLLLDPYGLAVAVPRNYSREAARRKGDNAATAMKSVVVDLRGYDWEGDAPLKHPSSRTIIYEMHVRGFTCHPSSGIAEEKRGTYAGLVEKIPYLRELGVTAVELLPVFQFDPQDCPPGRVNYWGYAPVSFFAPHQGYSSRQDPLGPVNEFRDMVKALHRAGLEVILDVVYNHTAEGGADGPILCFRGLENEAYYILKADKSDYENFTGCGNTLNTNEPVCRRIVLDSLSHWAREMHVDGFRFDLASILARDPAGQPMANPPVLWDIDSDPVLAGAKIIAEAWDAAGMYQVGSFIGDNWKEWNGRFRDDVRRFLRGDERTVPRLADRLLGSPDIYGHEGREAEQSVNFVTCHDGFTLMDLVSYDRKHNEANGEGNRDGGDDNASWNCGVEGPTDDEEVRRLRHRQVKNFHTITLLSLGLPMIQMGDEAGRSQGGNNNAYCQDNETSWFDWGLVERNADLHRFVSRLAARRHHRDVRAELARLNLVELIRRARFVWHGTRLNQPDWGDWSHAIAVSARVAGENLVLHWILNAYWEPLAFELPARPQPWRRWIDTALDPPDDIAEWESAAAVPGFSYLAQPRSTVVLFSTLNSRRPAETLPKEGL